MADFVAKSVTKSAERILTTPIDTMANFVALVNDFISTNPLGCVSYTSGGQTIAGVVRGTEYYSGKVVYEDGLAKTVGSISVKASTSSALTTDISTITGTAALSTAMGGTPSHDSSKDNFSCTVKCHASNGENYSITFKRDSVVFSSYEADEDAEMDSDSRACLPGRGVRDVCGSDLFFDCHRRDRLGFVCGPRGEIVRSNPLHERPVSDEP